MKKLIILLAMFAAVSGNSQTAGWFSQTSPTTQNLYGISFINTNTWIAVGGAGTILRTSNSGINWTIVTSTVVDDLRCVSMRGNLGIAAGISGRVIRTTDGGLNWVEETRPTTKNLYSVSIGNLMTVITGHEGTILVSTDDGLTWASHTAGTASIMFGVSVHDADAVGVGGQGAVVMSVNTGSGWGLTVLGGQLTFFYGTSFVNGNTGWAVGSSATTGNIIIKSSDAGFVWTGQTAPNTEQLFGVSFAAMDTGTAVGGNGSIIHTSNSGTTWVNQSSGTTQILNGVSFLNTNVGIAVGNGGTILNTTNGGLTGINNISNEVPLNFSLKQNYPNPFNPSTVIRFQMPDAGQASLKVYDAMGREVQTLVNERLIAGIYETKFEGSGLTSGVYFYKLITDGFTETKKMLMIK